MELIKVGEKTYYIKNATNIGVYKIDENNVYLIDSGNDKDAGKKILKIMDSQGWNIKGIISTHSNADHIGGNKLIQDRTGCPVYAYGMEKCFTEYPIMEPSFLFAGFPFKDLKNKFLLAKETIVTNINQNLPEGLEYFSLKGHFFDMIGVKTDDDVYFLADSLVSEETIRKYYLFFIYDIREYLKTLDFLSTLNGKLFIASHCEATNNILSIININRDKVIEICNTICFLCENEITFEDLLQKVFDTYSLSMNVNQYVLIGSTIRSYLSYLHEEGRVSFEFKGNKMYWKRDI